MAEQDIKSIMRSEYIRCAGDVIYFLRKYTYISHPQRGRILFNLYPYQEKVLKLWQGNPYSIIIKSRQLGISTLASGYAFWLILFHPDKNVLCLATKQDTAKNMVTKVKFMYDNIPSWLKVDKEENNRLTLRLKNGSQIKATSAASDAGRSEAVSLLLVDEAAFIDNMDELWTSVLPTLSTGGGCIALSTPNGTGNWFHKTYTKAETGTKSENDLVDFLPIKLPWFVHPERDQKWRDQQDELLGDPRASAQECDANFSTSGDTVFYGDFIEYYEKSYMKEPLEKRGIDHNFWVWEPADYSRTYLVSCDCARGDGKDYSTAQVIDVESNTQVAEYKGQIGTKEFGNMLVAIATEYNEALLVVENASIGWAVIQQILDRNYSNLYYSPKNENNGDINIYYDKYMDTSRMTAGFTNSPRTRPIMIGKFQEYVSTKAVTIQSKRLIEEMKVFIWKNGKAEAQQGYNDDLVISFSMAMYIRDTALLGRQNGADMTRQLLNNMHVNRTSYNSSGFSQGSDNPYHIETPYGTEDFTWLIR